MWELALESMGEASRRPAFATVAAIGLSVHGEAVTPVDADLHPLRPTILGMDTRTAAQNAWLRERFGARSCSSDGHAHPHRQHSAQAALDP